MKTHSPLKLNTYQIMGRKLRINFNEQFMEAVDEEKDSQYVYDTAEVDKLAKRDSVIESIMQTRYPTFGSELAAIRNGGTEAEDHESLRQLAKQLSDGWIEQRG